MQQRGGEILLRGEKRRDLRSFEISGVLKIKAQIKPSRVSGPLSISEGEEPRTAHGKQQRLGERSMLLLQQEEEGKEEEGGGDGGEGCWVGFLA